MLIIIIFPITTDIVLTTLPSGKRLHSELENHHFKWVNQLFLCAIFNSYVSHNQRVYPNNYRNIAIFNGYNYRNIANMIFPTVDHHFCGRP